MLLPELIVSLVLLQQSSPVPIEWLQLLGPVLDALDRLNRLAPHLERAELEDLAWPGFHTGKSFPLGLRVRTDGRNITIDFAFDFAPFCCSEPSVE